MFILRFILWFIKAFAKFIVFSVVGGGTLAMAIYYVDNFTNPAYGEVNLYIIAGAFSFFPMFTGLFVILLWGKFDKEKRNSKKRDKIYLKEEFKKKGLSI